MTGKDRERRLARERYERNLTNRAHIRERARRRNAILGATLGVLAVIGGSSALAVTLGDGSNPGEATAPPTSSRTAAPSTPPANSTTQAAGAGACDYTRLPESERGEHTKFVGLPPASPQPSTGTAEIETNHGRIVIELLADQAPCTVNSLAFLASKGFYEDTRCHRLVTGGTNILQCGDPSATGQGGPGYSFPDENLDGAEYSKGTVAMANSGADTNGSQFFMVFGEASFPPNYTPFGRITSGMDVLNEIAEQGVTGPQDQTPQAKVVIENLTISEQT